VADKTASFRLGLGPRLSKTASFRLGLGPRLSNLPLQPVEDTFQFFVLADFK
jgi:hypothetical protein